jgi:glutathione synthase/RimK-type ligase-like ATP-grasp enzyme
MKPLVIVTGRGGFMGQTRKPWVSMDISRWVRVLERHEFRISLLECHQVVNRREPVRDSLVFYPFSQKRNRREYILDMAADLAHHGNILIPSPDLLRCHENKGYQELYGKTLGLPALPSVYLSGFRELESYPLYFPLVLKTTDGSNGKGVYLIRSRRDLERRVRSLEKLDLFDRLDLFRRRYFRRKKRYPDYPGYSNRKDRQEYRDYVLRERNFILQEFVPDLEHDYRILSVFDRLYVMKRHNRKNDFRASGSKRFEFDFEPGQELMHFAHSVRSAFDAPFLSMDICPHRGSFALLEYQALHFGTSVISKNAGYYALQEGRWRFVPEKPAIEEILAEGLARYLLKRHGRAG